MSDSSSPSKAATAWLWPSNRQVLSILRRTLTGPVPEATAFSGLSMFCGSVESINGQSLRSSVFVSDWAVDRQPGSVTRSQGDCGALAGRDGGLGRQSPQAKEPADLGGDGVPEEATRSVGSMPGGK